MVRERLKLRLLVGCLIRESELPRVTGNKECIAHIISHIIMRFGEVRMLFLYLVLNLNLAELATNKKRLT